MEIETGKRIIAEFMGYDFYKGLFIHRDAETPIGNTIYPNELKYHLSWDWLHPVYVKIISEIGLWMMTNGYDKLWLEKSKEIEYAMLNEETPNKAAVLISQLIQWHNQNNKK